MFLQIVLEQRGKYPYFSRHTTTYGVAVVAKVKKTHEGVAVGATVQGVEMRRGKGMNTADILRATAHRPWALPEGRWRFYQEWNGVVFLHWHVDARVLREFVPSGLDIDVCEDKAWVSLVAFTMENVRPRFVPAVRAVSTFDEVNLRTYVRCNGKAAVYFLSIEAGKHLSCALARGLSGMPYRFSAMERTANHYSSANAEFGDRLAMEYRIGDALRDKTALDRWLTERYALFQDVGNALVSFDIHHVEWSLHNVEVRIAALQYKRFAPLLQGVPDKVHYSDGVQVIAWGKHEIR